MQDKAKIIEKNIRFLGLIFKWFEGILSVFAGALGLFAFAVRDKAPSLYENLLAKVNNSEIFYLLGNFSYFLLGILCYKCGKAIISKKGDSREKAIYLISIVYGLRIGLTLLNYGFQAIIMPHILFACFMISWVIYVMRTDEAKTMLSN